MGFVSVRISPHYIGFLKTDLGVWGHSRKGYPFHSQINRIMGISAAPREEMTYAMFDCFLTEQTTQVNRLI